VVFEALSPGARRVRVVERGPERRLVIGGEIQSVYFPGGDWSSVEREYWARALAPVRVRTRPRVLLVGLGGGTQVHLLRSMIADAPITAIERDPLITRIAFEWFGLRTLGGPLEILCADAERATAQLARARRRFDFVMDDISYAAGPVDAVRVARGLAGLVARGGVLVLNQHRRPAAEAVAEAVSDLLPRIRLLRVRREAENVLIFAEAPPRRPPRR
jgi:spermidine synthase